MRLQPLRLSFFLAILSVLFCAAAPSSLAAEIRQLKSDGITITYAADLESQAKDLMRAAKEIIPPSRKAILELKKVLSNDKKVAKKVVDLLGCPEHLDQARELIKLTGSMDFVEAMQSNLKLYRRSDLRASKGLKGGPMEITYNESDDSFDVEIKTTMINGKDAREFFWPIAINDDGTIGSKKEPLKDYLAELTDTFSSSPIAAIYGAAESVLVHKLDLSHPFTRWFNEGAAYWVLLKLAPELAPHMLNTVQSASLPRAEDAALRQKVNLLSWPQSNYDKKVMTKEEDEINSAHYRFATEALNRLLSNQPPDTLAKIIKQLKDRKRPPNTDAICAVIKKVTEVDFKAILLEYTPEYVRANQEGRDAGKIFNDGANIFQVKKDAAGALEQISRALEAKPENAEWRKQQIIMMLKAKYPKEEIERQLKLAAAMCFFEDDHNFRTSGKTHDEALYVHGRIALYLNGLNDTENGRMWLGQLDTNSPYYEDARAALRQLDQAGK